jgi:hypothetical protein
LSQRGRADEVVSLAEQCWRHGFEDAHAQGEFFQAPFKVDRSKVYPELEAHRSAQPEDQHADQGMFE